MSSQFKFVLMYTKEETIRPFWIYAYFAKNSVVFQKSLALFL